MLVSLDVVLDAQALEGEGRPGTVSQQPLAPGGVGAMDSVRGIEAEAAAGLPGEHAFDGVFVEESAAPEEAKHATLQGHASSISAAARAGGGRLIGGEAKVRRPDLGF